MHDQHIYFSKLHRYIDEKKDTLIASLLFATRYDIDLCEISWLSTLPIRLYVYTT